MSDVMEKTSSKFPRTVSACHVEIIRLRKAAEVAGGTSDRIASLEAERDELKDQLKAEEAENEVLTARVEELEENSPPNAIAAIDQFLFEVERPVGQFKFDVIHGASTDRAIIQLYAAVGRQP